MTAKWGYICLMIIYSRIFLFLLVVPFQSFISDSTLKNSFLKTGKEHELVSFEAISIGKKVVVNWTSNSEINFDYYTVEKSKDGVKFYPALMRKSAGKLSGTFEYIDVDYSPFSGISFYRLRRNDYNGEFSYSSQIVVNCYVLKDGTVVPLNSNSLAQSDLTDMEGKPVLAVVRDIKGAEFISKILVTFQNGKLVASDVKNELLAGEYFVVASSFNPLYHQKLSVK